MKALVSVVCLVVFGLVAIADPDTKSDYLVTKDGKIIVSKVKLGLFGFRFKVDDPSSKAVKYSDVISYRKDGEVYDKKPFYLNNESTGNEVFMKLVGWRNGYRLYKFEDSISDVKTHTRYYIFKDDNTFWLEVTSRNCETVTKFFNAK